MSDLSCWEIWVNMRLFNINSDNNCVPISSQYNPNMKAVHRWYRFVLPGPIPKCIWLRLWPVSINVILKIYFPQPLCVQTCTISLSSQNGMACCWWVTACIFVMTTPANSALTLAHIHFALEEVLTGEVNDFSVIICTHKKVSLPLEKALYSSYGLHTSYCPTLKITYSLHIFFQLSGPNHVISLR